MFNLSQLESCAVWPTMRLPPHILKSRGGRCTACATALSMTMRGVNLMLVWGDHHRGFAGTGTGFAVHSIGNPGDGPPNGGPVFMPWPEDAA